MRKGREKGGRENERGGKGGKERGRDKQGIEEREERGK